MEPHDRVDHPARERSHLGVVPYEHRHIEQLDVEVQVTLAVHRGEHLRSLGLDRGQMVEGVRVPLAHHHTASVVPTTAMRALAPLLGV
jgi:hypothetical protein